MFGALANWFIQHDPFGGQYPDEMYGPVVQEPSFSFGQIILFLLIGVAFQVLFGFWGRSKAEDHNVHPMIGFAAGFMLGYLGVRLVPLFKPGMLFAPGPRRPMPPGYPPTPMMQQQPPYPPPGAYPPPQGVPQPQAPQPPAPAVAADGYLQCTGCGARAKAGRRKCMTCGMALPMV